MTTTTAPAPAACPAYCESRHEDLGWDTESDSGVPARYHSGDSRWPTITTGEPRNSAGVWVSCIEVYGQPLGETFVNLDVDQASLPPALAREYARQLLEAADVAERQNLR